MDALTGTRSLHHDRGRQGSLFVPSGLKDGPLPAHYEPVESPVRNPLYGQQDNPVAKKWAREDNRYHAVGDPRYPARPHHVSPDRASLGRHADTLGRRAPRSCSPKAFAEIPPELASELGIENLDWVVLSTARGEIETRALVTDRLRPFEIDGRRIYPDRHAVALRLEGIRDRRHRQRPRQRGRRSEHQHPRGQGVHVQLCARAA